MSLSLSLSVDDDMMDKVNQWPKDDHYQYDQHNYIINFCLML